MKLHFLGGLFAFAFSAALVQAESNQLATQALSAGQRSALALRSDGTVWSWGTNRVGELGLGTNNLVPSPRRMASLSNMLAIAAGPLHSLAVGSNGTLWAWGTNPDGRLGNGTSVSSSNPVVVSVITNAVAVAAGATHSLSALGDGRVMAWGANNAGQLGTGNTVSTNKPVAAGNFTNVIAVAAGTNFSLALGSDGEVWSWGTNNSGQLGLGHNTSQTSPVKITALSNIVQIAAGHGHGLARDRDGRIYAWGRNAEGQIANSTTNNVNLPTQVADFGPTNAFGAARWIAANFNSSAAVGVGGRLFYWGAYGNGTINSNTTQVVELGANSGLEFETIAYGDSYLLAGQEDGSVWAWGFNLHGQWGNGAVRSATDTWRYESVNPVFSFGAQPRAEVTRYLRGDREKLPYTSFVLPLDMERGVQLDAEGSDQYCYGAGTPWFMQVKKTQRQHAWKRIGSTTNLTRFVVENPVVAFGSEAGGSPLYVGTPYTFGAYGGAFDEKTSQTNMIRILVYDRTALISGATNVQPTNTFMIPLPRRFIASDSNVWSNFITNNSRVLVETNGLRTAVEFADALLPDPVYGQNFYNNWGLGWQFAFAQNVVLGGYRITHQATSTNFCYIVEVMGSVEVGANVMAPMAVTNGTGWSHLPLYALGFEAFPEWRSHFVDTPHFEGIPLPPAYTGRRLAELSGLTADVTNAVWLTNDVAYTNLDASPELRRHPTLDQLVEDLGRDPLALAAYVVNEVELTDPLASYEFSKVVQDSVEMGGISRSALATYLEGQGSPAEQCALLVYLLRQAGYPAGYVFPTNNNLRLLDSTLSRLWQINVKGVQYYVGVPVVTNSLIAVNYPWVVANIGTNVVHIFPWLKNTEIVEGEEVYDFLPAYYSSAYPWIKDYALAKPELMEIGNVRDSAATLWQRYLTGVLSTNESQPNLSLDRFGVRAFNRRLSVAAWDDLPKPNFLTNQTQVAVVPTLTENPVTYPFLTNLFDRVRIEVFKDNTNSANKLFDTALWRACDLHNRKLLLYTNTASTLALWLAPYRDGLTNNSAFTNFESGAASLNLQLVQTNVAGTVSNLPVRVTYQRRAGTYATPASWYPLQEATPISSTFTAEKGAVTAIYPSFGRVTPAMQQTHAADYWRLQQQRAENPTFTPDVTEDAGTTATLLASSYFEKLWSEDQINQSLHKVKGLFWNSWGVIGLTKRTNGSMIIKLDMVWAPNLLLGNARLRQDSTDRGQLSLDNYRLMNLAIGASAEHGVIGDMFGDQTAISSVRLFQIAAERSRSNGLAMPLELNIKNYAALGNQTNTGYGSTLLKNQDANIWASISNVFTTTWDSNYTRVLITPGLVTNGTGKFKGMSAMTFGRWNGGAMLGVNSNVLNGGFTADVSWVGAPSFASYQLTYNLTYSPSIGYSFVHNNFSFAQPRFDFSQNDYVTLTSTNGVGLIAFTPQQLTQASSAAADLNVTTGTTASQLKTAKDVGWLGRVWAGVKQAGSTVSDPVHAVSGDFCADSVDLTLAGPMPLELRRNYFSRNLADNQFGHGWKLGFTPWLVLSTNSASIPIIQAAEPDGSVIAYRYQTNNVWIVSPEDNPTLVNFTSEGIGSTANLFNSRIEVFTNNGTLYVMNCPNGDKRSYLVMTNFGLASDTNYLNRVRPYLTQWEDHAGNHHTFSYGTNSSANDFGQLNRVQSANGAFLGLKYDVNGRITEAFTGDNRRVRYAYDSFGDLVKVTLPDDSAWQYEYQHYTFTTNSTTYTDSSHLLVKETKPDGRVLVNQYDDLRRVTAQAATVGLNRELVTNAWFFYTNNATSLTNDLLTGVTRVEDVFHNAHFYHYTNSLITRIIEPLGRTNVQDWFETGETNKPGYYSRSLELTVDPRGLTNEFRYSTNGNLTSLIVHGDLTGSGSSQSATNAFTFTTNNLLATFSNPSDNGVTLAYDDANDAWRPTSAVRIGGGVSVATNRFDYTNVSEVVTLAAMTRTNQAFGLLARVIRADSATNEWSYDGRGFPVQSIQHARTADNPGNTDPAVTNFFTFTDRGDLNRRTDALGRRVQMSHDAMGRMLWRDVLDENGAALARENLYYNRNGELEWYDGPRSNPEDFIWFDYDGAGRLVEQIRWRSRAKTDGSGVEAETGDNLYATTFHRYDPFGNLLATIHPNRAMTTNTWDALGRLSAQQVLDAGGTLLTSQGLAYEPGGLVTFHTNALQGVTERRYTSTGQLKYQKNADGSTNGWIYHLDGRAATNFLSNGAFWRTQHDDANRKVTRTFCNASGTPLATNVTAFDRRGNPVELTDAGGFTFTAAFDGLDRIKSSAGPITMTVSATGMDPDNPIYVTNFSQQITGWLYDSSGRTVTVTNAPGEKTVTTRDALGRTTRVETYAAGVGTPLRVTTVDYAPDHHGYTVMEGTGAGAISNTVYTANDGQAVLSIGYPSTDTREFRRFQFDAVGNLTLQEHDSATGNAVTRWSSTSYVPDALGRVTAMIDRDNAQTLFAYNAMGNVTNRTMPGGLQWNAVYNNAGQMTQEWIMGTGAVGTRTNSYSYFGTGSPLAGLLQTRVNPKGHSHTYAYDDWLRVTNVYRPSGGSRGALVTELHFDARGFATNITEWNDGFGGTGPRTVQRSFDAYGQLARETVSISADSYAAATQTTASQGWDAAGRRASLTLSSSSSTINYGFGWRADGLLGAVSSSSGGGSYGYDSAGVLTNRTIGNRSTTMTARDGTGRPLAITTKVNLLTKLTETLTWTGDGLLAAHTLAREDFTDARSYSYADLSRRLVEERLNLDGTQRWTNTFVYDSGTAGGLGVLTRAGAPDSSSASWSGGVSSLARVTTETNTSVRYPAHGRVNGPATITAQLDGTPLPVSMLSVGATNSQWPYQWQTIMEMSQGPHELTVMAAHPSGLFTTNTVSVFTNNATQETVQIWRDASGNATSKAWRNAAGEDIRSMTWAMDPQDRVYWFTMSNGDGTGWWAFMDYDAFGRRLRTRWQSQTNGITYIPPQGFVETLPHFDPEAEFLELGVTIRPGYYTSGQTTWKVLGPDLNGQYGGLNGTGGFEAVAEPSGQFEPVIADARGNVLGGVTNNSVVWTSARPTGYGAVPGYRPVPLGHGGNLIEASAWRGRWVDLSGRVNLGARPYNPETGSFETYDPVWNSRDPNYLTFAGDDPVNYFDADGRFGKRLVLSFLDDNPEIMFEGTRYHAAYINYQINEAIPEQLARQQWFRSLPSHQQTAAHVPVPFYFSYVQLRDNLQGGDYAAAGQNSEAIAAEALMTAMTVRLFNGPGPTPQQVRAMQPRGFMPGEMMPNGRVAGMGPGAASVGEIPQTVVAAANPGTRVLTQAEQTLYGRVSSRPRGFRDQVWERAKAPDGNVYDPTGRILKYDEPWELGHRPGHKFSDAQQHAAQEGWDRQTWIRYQNDPDIYRPELPSSNAGHRWE